MRFWTWCLVVLSGCSFFKPKSPPKADQIMAEVQGEILYKSDLDGIISAEISSSDSVKLIEKYINDWVKKQLMISAATQSTEVNEADSERKVLDYKYALIVHSFEKRYIDQRIDNTVSDQEIDTYYSEKADNFLLKQNLVKCVFAEIPKSAPNISEFRKNLKSYQENKSSVLQYASQFGTRSYLEDSVWVNFDEVIFQTPLEQNLNKSAFLRSTDFSETSDQTSIYFLILLDRRLIGETSPLEFIRDDIKNIIINKRKIVLKKQLEDQIYEDGTENGLVKIYSN